MMGRYFASKWFSTAAFKNLGQRRFHKWIPVPRSPRTSANEQPELPDTCLRQPGIDHENGSDPSFDKVLSYLKGIPFIRQPDQRVFSANPLIIKVLVSPDDEPARRKPSALPTDKREDQNKNRGNPKLRKPPRKELRRIALKLPFAIASMCPQLVILLCHVFDTLFNIQIKRKPRLRLSHHRFVFFDLSYTSGSHPPPIHLS